uniref:Probable chemoreceptor glutamine deamidase CheD n=1 Tax=Candidatus Methanosuratincola petrocarbonis (ex Vanwonterghem et al. 2016) TaxID=1867261 RepID=A0A7J3V1T6_9CREN
MIKISLKLELVDSIRDLVKGSLLVGMGEFGVSRDLPLSTLALGSCLAVLLYDPFNRIGGLLHGMVPTGKGKAFPKYLDYGIDMLLSKVTEAGGDRGMLVSGLVGGGTIFNLGGELAIGKRNIDFAKSYLKTLGIPILIEEVDGRRGRSLVFDVRTGRVLVMVSQPSIVQGIEAIEKV